MKKRIVSALLVCVLGMSLVTGCGNNAKAAETTKTADGKIQLDLWYSGGKTAVNVFQDIVDAFNESQDKYEVKTTTQADYTETYEKLQAGIAGKKAPDMALLDTDKSRNLSEKIWCKYHLLAAYELEQNEDKIKECLVFLDQHGNNTYMAKIAREKRKSMDI